MGDGNGSLGVAEPQVQKHMWGGLGMATQRVSFNFMSKLAIDAGVTGSLGLSKTTLPIKSVRHLRKKHMIRNDLLPWIEVDPQTFEVRADGKLLMCEPVKKVPLMRRYMLRLTSFPPPALSAQSRSPPPASASVARSARARPPWSSA